MQDECNKRNSTFNDAHKELFFGLYHSKTKEFRFLPGEKALLKEIGSYIKRVFGSDEGQNCVMFKTPTDWKIPRKDTCRVFGCTFFGKKSYNKPQERTKDDDHEPNTSKVTSMKSTLLSKLQREFGISATNLSEMIEIVSDSSRIVAAIFQCIRCYEEQGKVKKIRIQCDPVKNSQNVYWNTSNFKKHWNQQHLMKKSKDQGDKYEEVDVETCDENSIDEYVVLNEIILDPSANASMEDDTRSHESIEVNEEEYALYSQISCQNGDMKQAMCLNQEETETMQLKFGENSVSVNVIKVEGDGDCVFGSLIHQMCHHQLNSTTHDEATRSLRKSTVEFIQNNFKDFLFDIKGRLLEEREANSEENMKGKDVTEADCRHFLDEKLSKGAYGGSESIKAISIMCSVNILVFVEFGPAYYPLHFNPDYQKTVFIAHRLATDSIEKRNHYDSVAEVDLGVVQQYLSYFHAKSNLSGNSNSIEIE